MAHYSEYYATMERKKARVRIVKNVVISDNGCWIWAGNPRENGYCRTTFQWVSWYIHRLSYWAFCGDIPEGHDVCHKCDVRACCNPEHLFTGTRLDNMRDAAGKGRVAKGFQLPQSKLSDKDKKEILELINQGMKYKEIANLYNVHRTAINSFAIKQGVRKNGRNSK